MKISAILPATSLALWLSVTDLQAHDFWIEAFPFNAREPQTINVTLNVGMDMAGETLPNIADWYDDFSYVYNGKRQPMPGQMGDDPAGQLPANAPGLYLIGHENRPDYVELEAERFEKYLKEEGLEGVIKQRHASGNADKPGQEFYRRCVKALVRVGDSPPSTEALGYVFGYRLEMIPLNSPYAADRLKLRVLFDGEPVEGLLVTAFTKRHPDQHNRSRTDARGYAEVDISRPGKWLIKTVHMLPYENSGADWISYWGSLTFERP